MDRNSALSLIGKLTDANGISGFEDEVVALIREMAGDYGSLSEDAMRNVYLERKENRGGRPILMLDAHSDEIGFMVKAIRPDGMLEFTTIGGWVATNIPAHIVRVMNSEGRYIEGVVATRPPHFLSEAERKAELDVSRLVIDVGATSAEEIINDFKIDIAAPVVPDASFHYDGEHDIMRAKAFDNRLGCAAIICLLDELKGLELDVDIVAAFASQEEVGTRGATVTVARVKPDVAICFEGCPADDTVVESYRAQTCLKKGPMLRDIDMRMITNPRFQRFALDTAKACSIPCQRAVRTGGATDAGPIHIGGKAIASIVMGIPVRYAHTHYGYATYFDFSKAVSLAAQVVKRLDRERIESF